MNDHLLIALDAAVPLRIMMIRDRSPEMRASDGAFAVDVIASKSDALMFGGRKGEAANAFNWLVKGLAALAYQPGGATFAGRHWCVNHTECEAAEAAAGEPPDPVEVPEPRPAVDDVPTGGLL